MQRSEQVSTNDDREELLGLRNLLNSYLSKWYLPKTR
jgi:hypothetical protein